MVPKRLNCPHLPSLSKSQAANSNLFLAEDSDVWVLLNHLIIFVERDL